MNETCHVCGRFIRRRYFEMFYEREGDAHQIVKICPKCRKLWEKAGQARPEEGEEQDDGRVH